MVTRSDVDDFTIRMCEETYCVLLQFVCDLLCAIDIKESMLTIRRDDERTNTIMTAYEDNICMA